MEKKIRPRATLLDIAELSGISLKTVSRVLNKVATVDPKLVAKVQEAAKKVGYTPNMNAASLRGKSGKTLSIGILLEDISNPFSAALHRTYEIYARKHNYIILAASLEEDPLFERELVNAFISRRVDGLIIAPSNTDHSYLEIEQKTGIHFGFIDRPASNFLVDTVLSTNRESSVFAVEHLMNHGHRNIAFIHDSLTYTGKERFSGYKTALKKAGIPLNKDYVLTDNGTGTDTLIELKNMLLSHNPPTAIYSARNSSTVLAVRTLKELNLENKIALIGFDDVPGGDLFSPAVSVLMQDVTQLGLRSAQLLFSRIEGHTGPAVIERIPTKFIARGSGEIRPLGRK